MYIHVVLLCLSWYSFYTNCMQKFVNFSKTASSQLKSLAQEAETDSEVNSLNLHCISPQISAEYEFSAHSCVVCNKQIMTDDFLEGKMLETDFIRNFMEKRKVSHVMYCIYMYIREKKETLILSV